MGWSGEDGKCAAENRKMQKYIKTKSGRGDAAGVRCFPHAIYATVPPLPRGAHACLSQWPMEKAPCLASKHHQNLGFHLAPKIALWEGEVLPVQGLG